jgi:hypothetical protein
MYVIVCVGMQGLTISASALNVPHSVKSLAFLAHLKFVTYGVFAVAVYLKFIIQ